MSSCDARPPALVALVWLAVATSASAGCSGPDDQPFGNSSGFGGFFPSITVGPTATSTASTSSSTTSSTTTGMGGGMPSCHWDGPTALWQKNLSHGGYQSPYHVASDPDGNVIVAGSACGGIDLGGGVLAADVICPYARAVFVAKYSPAGDHLWSRAFGDGQLTPGSAQWPSSLEIESDGTIFIAGAFDHWINFGDGPRPAVGEIDAFVTKLAPDGTLLWGHVYGDDTKDGAAVALDGSGHALVAVVSEGKLDLGGGLLASAGGDDIFIVKLDAAGNHVWSKRFGAPGDQRLLSFAASPGGIGLFGIFLGTLDFGNMPLATTPWASFAAKLDLDGNPVWAHQYPTASDVSIYYEPYWMEFTHRVKIDPFGSVLLDAEINFSGGPQILGACPCLAKFDANGNLLWSKKFAKYHDGFNRMGIVTQDNGHVLLTGRFIGPINFGAGPLQAHGARDVFLAKLDADGKHIWSRRAGDDAPDTAYEHGYGIAADANGNVLLSGRFSQTICFGLDTLVVEDVFDGFVVKLPPL